MDSTGHEIFLLGNFNIDVMPDVNTNNSNQLKAIFPPLALSS